MKDEDSMMDDKSQNQRHFDSSNCDFSSSFFIELTSTENESHDRSTSIPKSDRFFDHCSSGRTPRGGERPKKKVDRKLKSVDEE